MSNKIEKPALNAFENSVFQMWRPTHPLRQPFKFTMVLLCSVTLLLTCSVAQSQQLPNIVIIFADDLGYGDIEGFGADYPTPNLVKLQAEGMRFTNFYSQPQCSPSRAALMTGCYPQRVGVPWVVGPEGPEWTRDKSFVGLNPNEKTIAEVLKDKNYATACIGKWHLGHHTQHLPTHHGFDMYFGLPYSNDMWPENMPAFPDLPLVENEKTIEKNPDQSQLVRRYTERAQSFIKQNKKKNFFLYIAHAMPHVPIYASQQFAGKSGKGLYADVIQEIDWSVGEVMKSLKTEGLEENTLVIFTSDNGPWLVYGNHAGSSGGLREGKGTAFEGGVRVPFIARWPKHIPSNSSCSSFAGLIDLLPTVADITNTKTLPNAIDGKSMLPLLLGKSKQNVREVHYYFQINELQAVRKGKWKLHFPHNYEHVAKPGMDGVRGQFASQSIGLSLFDLETDPGEATDVSSAHPDIVSELKALGEKFRSEMDRDKRQAADSR
ncbi:MAG TPA: sulfatase [Chryseolinea sp.]